MKYIKNSEEFSINEELEIGWKEIIIALGIIYGLNYYFDTDKLSSEEIDKVIYDINNKPSLKDDTYIKIVKEELIRDIMSTNNMDKTTKDKVISAIRNIKFISVSPETMKMIGGESSMACYFRRFSKVGNSVAVIIIDKNRLSHLGSKSTIIHELRHLVDDVMAGDSFDNEDYSEFINIVDILDKDIILQTELGKKKLHDKIDLYSEILVEFAIKEKIGDIKKPEVKKLAIDAKQNFKDEFIEMLSDSDDMEYLTSPGEIYVRFHGLKRWMIKNGYLEDINDLITQEKIIEVLRDRKLLDETLKHKLDFFELLFYLDVDVTGKTKSDLTKANSIVANYTDYLSTKRDT